MYNGVNKTMCSYCAHFQVCSYKEQFLAACKAVDEIMIHYGDRSSIQLRNIPWVRPVNLECTNFLTKQQTESGL